MIKLNNRLRQFIKLIGFVLICSSTATNASPVTYLLKVIPDGTTNSIGGTGVITLDQENPDWHSNVRFYLTTPNPPAQLTIMEPEWFSSDIVFSTAYSNGKLSTLKFDMITYDIFPTAGFLFFWDSKPFCQPHRECSSAFDVLGPEDVVFGGSSQLVSVEPVPIPPTILLFISALAGVSFFSRKCKISKPAVPA